MKITGRCEEICAAILDRSVSNPFLDGSPVSGVRGPLRHEQLIGQLLVKITAPGFRIVTRAQSYGNSVSWIP